MKLSILIVSWNTKALLGKCLDSILQFSPPFPYEVIVVDNASSDGSAEAVASAYAARPEIRLIRSAENLGFARGNNAAYEASQGELVLLLNPDTEVLAGALQSLARYLDEHPQVSIVGPKILSPDGTLQPSVRRFPDIWSSVLVFSGLHRVWRPRRYLMDDFSYDREAAVDQVMGAALLTRRSIIKRLGFLDEKFWLWYEEVDFCKRAQAAGFGVMFYPGAAIIHKGAQSFSQLAVYERKKIVAKSLLYYFRKNGGSREVLAIRIIMPLVLGGAKLLQLLQKIFKFGVNPHA